MKQYCVLGASAAGIHAVRAIRSLDQSAEITLISEDSAIYSRCILHHYLSGLKDENDLSFVPGDFIPRHRVRWLKGSRAVSLDCRARQISLADGGVQSYDALLIATGASTAFPPIPGLGACGCAAGVYGLRTLEDARKIKAAARNAQNILILGGGLIGLDAASGLLGAGKRITLIEGRATLLPIQLDERAARPYQEAFAKLGGKQFYGVTAREIIRNSADGLAGVSLSNGESLPCDMLICATGVKANAAFLAGSGIRLDEKGLACNERGETSVEAVYGAGDVSGKSPIWPQAVKEGIIAGTNMAGGSAAPGAFFASKSALSFWGVKTLSLGIHTPPDNSYTVVVEDRGDSYKKIIHKDGLIYGAVIQGDLSYAGILTQLIAEKIDVSRVKKPLFAIDYSDFFSLKQNFEFAYDR